MIDIQIEREHEKKTMKVKEDGKGKKAGPSSTATGPDLHFCAKVMYRNHGMLYKCQIKLLFFFFIKENCYKKQ